MNKIILVSSSKKQIHVDNILQTFSFFTIYYPKKKQHYSLKFFLKAFGSLRHTCSTEEQRKCLLLQQTQINKLQSEKKQLKNRLSIKYFR